MTNIMGSFIHSKAQEHMQLLYFFGREVAILVTFTDIFLMILNFNFNKYFSVFTCQTCVTVIHKAPVHYSSSKWVEFD